MMKTRIDPKNPNRVVVPAGPFALLAVGTFLAFVSYWSFVLTGLAALYLSFRSGEVATKTVEVAVGCYVIYRLDAAFLKRVANRIVQQAKAVRNAA